MSNSLPKKPFLNYQSQLNHLKQKQLLIPDEAVALATLEKYSYYSLINGYKDIFKDSSTNKFYQGTTYNDILNLYLFDAELREIFFKFLLIFEKHIKSSLSYHFSNLYGSGIAYYQDITNYDYGKKEKEVQYLFQKMNSKINGKHPSPQVVHYIKTYHDIPLWVLTTDLTIGEIASMYRYLKGRCKTLICNDFHHIGRHELGQMLILLTKYRNICAHGNRLFNYQTQNSIPDLPAHQKLKIPKIDSQYAYGKSDLFAAVISLKYLLDEADFRQFYYALKKVLKKYAPSHKTLQLMGFPTNWMSILRIKVY